MTKKTEYKCGIFGTLSRLWKFFTGHLPPFEKCCEEHDLAYEQIETEADRIWADAHFLRCMDKEGWRVLGYFCRFLIRYFGWVTYFMKKKEKKNG